MRRTEGLEVPVHRSIVEPMLLAGLPRTVALVLWTVVGALALGLRQIWVVPIGLGMHAVFAAVTKADPYFFAIARVALKTARRMEP